MSTTSPRSVSPGMHVSFGFVNRIYFAYSMLCTFRPLVPKLFFQNCTHNYIASITTDSIHCTVAQRYSTRDYSPVAVLPPEITNYHDPLLSIQNYWTKGGGQKALEVFVFSAVTLIYFTAPYCSTDPCTLTVPGRHLRGLLVA